MQSAKSFGPLVAIGAIAEHYHWVRLGENSFEREFPAGHFVPETGTAAGQEAQGSAGEREAEIVSPMANIRMFKERLDFHPLVPALFRARPTVSQMGTSTLELFRWCECCHLRLGGAERQVYSGCAERRQDQIESLSGFCLAGPAHRVKWNERDT